MSTNELKFIRLNVHSNSFFQRRLFSVPFSTFSRDCESRIFSQREARIKVNSLKADIKNAEQIIDLPPDCKGEEGGGGAGGKGGRGCACR